MARLKKFLKKYNESYHAFYLLLGTSRGFLIADFGFIFDAVIDPIFTKRKLSKLPFYIWGIIAIIAISSIQSPEWFTGMTTALRVMILALVLPSYKYGYKFKAMTGVILIGLTFLVLGQSVFMTRSIGIHSNASMLGQTALVYAPIFWLHISIAVIMILTLSIARSPLVALILFAAIKRERYFLVLASVAAVLFIFYASISTPGRISIPGITYAINDRIETIIGHDDEILEERYYEKICGEFRDAEYSLWGYGWNGFCKNTGQPRPHNIYFLSVYDLGILAVPFWIFILIGAYKFGIWKLAPLFALGLVTDELLGRPEGIYLIAIWIIAVNLSGKPDADVDKTIRKFG